MWNVISEQREQIYPFLTEQVEAFSPTGRYLLAQINGRYLVLDLENGAQTILPELNLNSAVFSADEQQLYLLTYTEVLVWDTSRQTMSHTIAPPAEWQGRSWSCLNLLEPDEFLLVIDNHELWRWSVNENHTQKLFTSELRNIQKCEFTHGVDWLLVEESYAHLQLLNLADGRLLWQTSPMRFENWAVSPDGRYLAGSDSDYTYLFDFEFLRQQR
jgi:WD40 repeat protein